MKLRLAFAAALAAAVIGVGQAQAAVIVFTETTTASGSLNGVTFTNALVTMSGSADTSAITQPFAGIYVLANIPVSVTVQGLGTAHFSDDIQAVSNQNNKGVGFGDVTLATGLLFTGQIDNAGYDLSTPFGPVTGLGALGFPGTTYATDQGGFRFSATPSSSTFQATLAAVPEPSTWLLITGGLGAAGAVLRRRRAPALA
jgi:hypothetical protein